MVEVRYENLMPLATAKLPGDPSRSTRLRWPKGVKGPGGSLVKLRVTRVGGRLFVSPKDVQDFLDALNPEPGEEPEPAAGTTTDRRAAVRGNAAERSAAADLALEALGG